MPVPKSSQSNKKLKKVKRQDSNVFQMFTEAQAEEFKAGFTLIDSDHDGVISKEDLRNVHNKVGRIATEDELEDMLSDAPGPINFLTLMSMFGERLSEEIDEDDVVADAFRAFEINPGMINAEELRSSLVTFGDKFTDQEVDEVFEAISDVFDNDNKMIDSNALLKSLCGTKDD
ncbi:unnamed protein product [Meganyctiphanes norvegica]|uniref:EF-hand domain-containing protein n=1 Tax=Meganyctiphanes norvegica TaxID=48144 RepID=A0AAV2QHL7_MEGNR